MIAPTPADADNWSTFVVVWWLVPNILILNSIVPFPANYNGNSIRVFPLSCQIAQRHQCYLAAFGVGDDRYEGVRQTGVYKDILLLPERQPGGGWRRYSSLRYGNLARVSQPEYFRDIVNRLRKFINRHAIDLVVAHTMQVAEFAEALADLPVIMDEIDCRYLSQRRKIDANTEKRGLRSSLTDALALFRASSQEGAFTKKFRYVTTVSPVDRKVLQDLAKGGKGRIVDIPNGIAPELNDYPLQEEQPQAAVAFWGALDFPPNRYAVSWFYNEVFLPFLADAKITWYIIGRNAGDDVNAMAAAHENIIATGFIDDLYGLVSRIPVMINPMKLGGGLKNKVLEAFALQRVVISNALGMEAVSALPGVHYVQAETPQEFADAVTKYTRPDDAARQLGARAREFVLDSYTWAAVGERFCRLIDAALKE